MMRKGLALLLSCMLLCAPALAAQTGTEQTGTEQTRTGETLPEEAASGEAASGENAPAAGEEEIPNYFAMIEAADLYGAPFDAQAFTQGVTLVNVWATWCGYCVKEIPALSKLSQEYEGRMGFVALCTDALDYAGERDEDAIAGAQALWEKSAIAFPSLVPDAMSMALINALEVQSLPTTWFVDARGRILYEQVGALSEEQWRSLIDQVLAYAQQGA